MQRVQDHAAVGLALGLPCAKPTGFNQCLPPWYNYTRNVSLFAFADLIAASLLEQHHPDNLRKFASQHIRRWMDNSMVVYVGWGHGELMQCEVHEIEPEGDHLLSQNQYRLNEETGEYDTVRVPSPPIGMICMWIDDWRKKLDTYLNQTLERNFHNFPERCFRGRDMEVQKDLLNDLHCCYLSGAGTVSKLITNCSCLLTCIPIIGIRLVETWLQTRYCDPNHDAYFNVSRRKRSVP